jgi:stage II sporulation protein D (peptidoglycan lytic transglycosylase)
MKAGGACAIVVIACIGAVPGSPFFRWTAARPTAAGSLSPSLSRGLTPGQTSGQTRSLTPGQTSGSALVESLRVGVQKPGGGYTLQALPLETYVARVLAGEAARDSPETALEALAITVRTFALANRGRHHADGFDLCDQTHCQVLRPATALTERAAVATAGRVLVARGSAIASVFYSASCGGRTEIPSQVWPGADDPPYLPSHRDDACGGEPAWSADLRASDLLRAFRAAGFTGGPLRDLRIAARNSSGRVARLRLTGLRPDGISGQELRVAVGRTLGWQHIKSTVFDLRKQGDVYRFSGRGSGHGVGLCVIGSTHLAAAGKSATDILARYFPGLTISPLTISPFVPVATTWASADSEIAVALPEGDDGDRSAVVSQVRRLRDELAQALGVTPAPRVVLRFHATTDEYEHATGQAWFTSGAAIDGELHFLPLVILRERGIFERVVRHELVHVLTDPVLGQRAGWVREGAAIYFAGDQKPPTSERPAFKPGERNTCPDDGELLLPVSVGALSNAYARARACFARQIQSGKSWRDVK